MTISNRLPYEVLLHEQTWVDLSNYLNQLINQSVLPGAYFQYQIQKAEIEDLSLLDLRQFLNLLLRTKKPQIFAEMAVSGDGSDWSRQELKILGDIGVACKVTIFDDGRHQNPNVHDVPFEGHLLFTAGALLRNGRKQTPADWDVVNDEGQIDPERYYALYERRLLPLLLYANDQCKKDNKQAVVTIPGLVCGQFAGRFLGQLGEKLEAVLLRILSQYRSQLDYIELVYFDAYQECTPKTVDIDGLAFIVNPLSKSTIKLNQLSYPNLFVNREYSDSLLLFSLVAWDHVSWPGNDFYEGARATDDGVKAAATNSMQAMTGVAGNYDANRHCYLPPKPYKTWSEVVKHSKVILSS